MKIVVIGVLGSAILFSSAAQAQSCFDLWYERNLIYAENGYCFSTSFGRHTFASFECWTSNPRLTAAEQRRVAALKAEEKRRGCKVN